MSQTPDPPCSQGRQNALRELLSDPAAACPACQHGLAGLDVSICPECGHSLRAELKAGPVPLTLPAKLVFWYFALANAISLCSWLPIGMGRQRNKDFLLILKSNPPLGLYLAWSVFAMLLAAVWILKLRDQPSPLTLRRVCVTLVAGALCVSSISVVFYLFR